MILKMSRAKLGFQLHYIINHIIVSIPFQIRSSRYFTLDQNSRSDGSFKIERNSLCGSFARYHLHYCMEKHRCVSKDKQTYALCLL